MHRCWLSIRCANSSLRQSTGQLNFPGEQFILNYQISYSYFPDKFWDLGKAALGQNEESYTFRQYYLYGHLQRKVRNHVFAGLQYEYQ